MIELMVATLALFSYDNATFFKDVENKQAEGYKFCYVSKREARPDVPNIAVDNKYIYFTMEGCNEKKK